MEAPPPALPDELIEEILLRLPPGEPACILRASLVCKAWGRAVSHPTFRRRLHDLHRTPPVLGFLRKWDGKPEQTPRFVPTTASSFSLAAPDYSTWRALDFRDGRALFLSKGKDTQELLVWEPITGGEWLVPVPAPWESRRGTAAVFCAADGCDHRGCHRGPFQLVLVFTVSVSFDDYATSACVYSSETGTWGPTSASLHSRFDMDFTDYPSVLVVGRSLLYFMSDDWFIVEYDLARHGLAVIDALDIESRRSEEQENINLVLVEDDGMRVCQVLHPNLKFWKREASNGPDAQAQWVLSRVINLVSLLQIGAVLDDKLCVVGFAEGANVIFVDTVGGIFTVELQSEKVRKVCDDNGFCNLIPVVGFFTPLPRGEHQDPPSSGPSEKAVGEEEKAVEQQPQLFENGSNAIEEGVNAFECVSRDMKIRAPHYEEVNLERTSTLNIYGCTLPTEDKEVINPSGDVPRSAPNEESVKGTSSKDDARNSTTSDCNDECAPPFEKCDFE